MISHGFATLEFKPFSHKVKFLGQRTNNAYIEYYLTLYLARKPVHYAQCTIHQRYGLVTVLFELDFFFVDTNPLKDSIDYFLPCFLSCTHDLFGDDLTLFCELMYKRVTNPATILNGKNILEMLKSKYQRS